MGSKTSMVLEQKEGWCILYKDVGKVGEKISCEYHLTEPVKISMLERSKLVQVVEEFITFL